MKSLKNETIKLKQNSYISQVKQNFLKQDYSKTMDTWATTGFSKYPKYGSPEIYKEFGGSVK